MLVVEVAAWLLPATESNPPNWGCCSKHDVEIELVTRRRAWLLFAFVVILHDKFKGRL